MFGRNREPVPPQQPTHVEISPEEKERLLASAMGRIVSVEFLDGYPLPPDNDEPYEDRMLTIGITHIVSDQRGNIDGWTKTVRRPSRITNAEMRASTIDLLSRGRKPLAMHEEEMGLRDKTPEEINAITAKLYGTPVNNPSTPVRIGSDLIHDLFDEIDANTPEPMATGGHRGTRTGRPLPPPRTRD